jgi:hypothetical protein
MRKCDYPAFYKKTVGIPYQSQTISDDSAITTTTEVPSHCLWQIYNTPGQTENSSVEKKEHGALSCDETFWFDVVNLPEITQESILSKEEIQAQIYQYEQKFGLSSQEFIKKHQEGNVPDTFETMDWIMLLDYQTNRFHHDI